MVDLNITKFDLSALKQITGKLAVELDKAVRATAFFVEKQAKLECPVDTGALRASIYTVTSGFSGRQSATKQAVTKAGKGSKRTAGRVTGENEMAPEIPQPQQPYTAIVAVGMAYGIHVEYGTGRMQARPFLGPAGERAKPFLAEQVRQAVIKSAKDSGFKT